ncbi:MAG: helix-turn-helix domain-containing protein [Nitrososphaera sp.]
MSLGKKLREDRVKKGWTLKDIADALGVTIATVSRVERDLQEPSSILLQAWERILYGNVSSPHKANLRDRLPRAILKNLAGFFLSDVRAGMDANKAGWREPTDLGFSGNEPILRFSTDLEIDESDKVRVNPQLSMTLLREASSLLEYRKTLSVEEESLKSVQPRLENFWNAIHNSESSGAITVAGLSFMIRASAHHLQGTFGDLNDNSFLYLLSAPTEAAICVVESTGIKIQSNLQDSLESRNLTELVELVHDREWKEQARKVAAESLVPLAKRISDCTSGMGAIAMGSAWAYMHYIQRLDTLMLTEAGLGYAASLFWQGTGFSRSLIQEGWKQFLDQELDEHQRVASLVFGWPEVV